MGGRAWACLKCRQRTQAEDKFLSALGCRAMRILVTGSRGKVGSATVDALHRAGHDVTACDLGPPVFEAAPPGTPRLQAGRPHRRRRRVRGRARPRRRDPRRRDPRADAQPAAHRLPQQPDGRLQHARGGHPLRRAALRQRLERDRPGLLLPRAAVAPRLRAGRRGAPDPPAGPLRDRQVLLRAADGRRDAPLGHPLPDDPPQLGAVGGQLRPQPRPHPARSRGLAPSAGPVGLHRRLRPRRRAGAWPPSPTSTRTRSSTSPRPTTTPIARSPT